MFFHYTTRGQIQIEINGLESDYDNRIRQLEEKLRSIRERDLYKYHEDNG